MHCGKHAVLFNHLVGAGEECRWGGEAERFGGLEVDDEVEFDDLLDRDVSGFSPAQNLVDQVGRTPIQIGEVGSVGDQSS
jgi:hypothetical protein